MASLPVPDFGEERAWRAQRDEAVRSLLLLNQAAQQISSILDLDKLLDKIVNEIATAFNCSLSALLLKDEETGDLLPASVARGIEPRNTRYRVGRDGMVGHAAALGTMYYAPDVRKDPYYIRCVADTLSEVDIPLKVGDQLIGVFSAQRSRTNAFSRDELQLFEVLAGHIAVAVRNARLFQRERREKVEAQAIQRSLFPTSQPDVPGFRIDGDCISAGEVGGDWYDFVPLRSSRRNRTLWGLVLGDVCGKGMAAALLMCSTRALLRSLLETYSSPAKVLARLNRILLADLPRNRFVTMVLALLDPGTRTLTLANAGHPWPIHACSSGLEFLETESGLPLGIAESDYDEQVVYLRDDSRVVFYSDGVSDSGNGTAHPSGEERLRNRALERDVSARGILRDIATGCRGEPLCDDATVIVVRSEEPPQLRLGF
jgi:sigma-B regulation protein RsbU (phosphoserine phosphatase)